MKVEQDPLDNLFLDGISFRQSWWQNRWGLRLRLLILLLIRMLFYLFYYGTSKYGVVIYLSARWLISMRIKKSLMSAVALYI
jgi:hypothetical protein